MRFNKVAGYRSTYKKSVLFLHTSSEKSKKAHYLIYNSIEKNEVRILTEKVQDLYTLNVTKSVEKYFKD